MTSKNAMSPQDAVRCTRGIAEAAWPVVWDDLPKLWSFLGWVGRKGKPEVFRTGTGVDAPEGLALPAMPGVLGLVNFALNSQAGSEVQCGEESGHLLQAAEELRAAVFAGLSESWGRPTEDEEFPGERYSKWALGNGAEVELSRMDALCTVTVRSPQDVAFAKQEEESL